jgi:hypothetical protein
VELDGKVLVIRRIHVKLHLKTGEAQREAADRVHGFFATSCPVYRSLHPQIAITTELLLETPA